MSQIPYLDLISPPTTEPLTVTEVKAALRIDGVQEDGFILNLIKAARVMAEEHLKRSLITQTWQLQYDKYAPSVIALPRGPVQSVVAVKVIDREWVEQAIDPTTYYLNAGKESLVFEASAMGNIVQVRYVAGYGTVAQVPTAIKQGMLSHVVNMYENRSGSRALPEDAMALYKNYRIIRL